mgnify:FL=1
MAIKLIALDLDGTLLTSDKRITTRTKDIIARAMARGVTVTIATGRMLRSAVYFARLLASDAPVICCNGGYVGRAEGAPVFARYFDPLLAREFLTFCYEQDWYVNWYRGMDIYAPMYREDYFAAYRTTANFVVNEVGNDYLRYTENVPQFVLRNLDEGISPYLKTVQERFGDAVLPQQNTGTSLDINPPGVSKAVGVQALADAMGLTLDEVMVAGDADNDFEMLEMGAFAVVPENGLPAAKERASYVTASNDANGIAAAIEKFVL